MTKKELAKHIGVTERTISRWVERGMPYKTEYQGLKPYLVFDEVEVEEWLKTQKGAY